MKDSIILLNIAGKTGRKNELNKDLVMSHLQVFESRKIRAYYDEEKEKWYFSVIDVIEALTDSPNSRRYWSDLKRKLAREGADQLYENIVQLKLKSQDNRLRETDCADIEAMLRIIQSIPSPKAEPMKQWLAQVGRQRIEEIERPELAVERMRGIYRAKGYDEEWIEKRIQSIAVRNELTDEWEYRDVKPGKEFAILTAEISRGTFNITPSEHKQIKGLKREDLRDHMTPLELIFTMLGEATTTEIIKQEDARGFEQNKHAAQRGGRAAGKARREIEAETGKPVVSEQNYLTASKKKRRLKE
jgi:DNA-damage-inducible protein D